MIYDLLIVFSSPFLPIHTYPVLPVSVLSASSAIDFMYRLLITYTLKGLKTQKSKFIIFTLNVSILFRFSKNEHQYVSKTCFEFYVKLINNVRATVYQIAIPYDSKAAI